tara:strand:+ start:643 stop:936 length:294 start_codon:yes stop_codon:yes gene_type:complete
MSEDTPIEEEVSSARSAMIRSDILLGASTAEIDIPAGDIESIGVAIATGETSHERIWTPVYVDTSGWDLTVTEGVLVLDLPDDLPDYAQCVVTVEYN